MKNSLYIKDMVSIDHAYISPYGEVLGNSVTLNLDVSGFESGKLIEVKSVLDYALAIYVNKLWIVEGFSEALITIRGIEYRLRARDFFPDDFKAEIAQLEYSDQILIKTNGYEIKIIAGEVSFLETDAMWGMNTTYSFYEQLIVGTLDKYLTDVLIQNLFASSNGEIDVKTEVVEFDAPQYENSLYESVQAPYVILNPTDAGTLRLNGTMGYIATSRRSTGALISAIVTDSVFVDADSSSLIGNRLTAADGTYIEWFAEEFTEKTNLSLHVTRMNGGTSLDNISQYFCSGYLSVIDEYVIWLQGRNNGVKVSL